MVDTMTGSTTSGGRRCPHADERCATFPTDPKLLGDEPAARAEVLVDEPRAAAIERELGAAAVVRRLPDGAVVVEVPCTNLDAFRSWLFGLGEHAEVLGPAGVRSAVVEWLQAMAGAR